MTNNEWKQIQKIELPPGFVWERDDNAWGIQTRTPHWWHWFQYVLADSMSYPQNSIWYHRSDQGEQHQATIIDDPIHAAHYMAAKIYLGMYE